MLETGSTVESGFDNVIGGLNRELNRDRVNLGVRDVVSEIPLETFAVRYYESIIHI